MEQYRILGTIGEGAHGCVFKAIFVNNGETVALKKIPIAGMLSGGRDTSIPTAVLREMEALRVLDHRNVVRLRDSFASGSSVVLVFDYLASDLSCVLQCHPLVPRLRPAHVKGYLKQLLQGVAHCHSHNVLHRDLKPANLLIAPATRRLQLADFGLARVSSDRMSYAVATRWYRAPELLYGSETYDSGVDMWAVGCIFGELLNGGSPLFCGENDIDQLYQVQSVLGTPTEEVWPGLSCLPDYGKIEFDAMAPVELRSLVPDAPASALSLLSAFLVYDSTQRMSADAALVHDYFFEDPLPCVSSELPCPPSRGALSASL